MGDTTKSHVLALETLDLTTVPCYETTVEAETDLNTNKTNLDRWFGHLTASHCSVFHQSGTVSTQLASAVGAEYASFDRVIVNVKAWAARSGSGGVTRVNVQRQEDGVAGAFVSIYSNNAFKPAVSQSLGDYGIASGGTVSGSVWKAGTVLKVLAETAADVQADLYVQVNWRPSGAYNF